MKFVPIHRFARVCAAALLALGLQACVSNPASEPFPPLVVSVDHMKFVVGMRVNYITSDEVEKKEKWTNTVILLAHVDESGAVRRVSLHESSGNPDLDESAMKAMRFAKFAPYLLRGVATAVTVVAPLHFPKPAR